MNNSGKPFLVLTFFMLLIALFAGGAMSNTDLTPNTPPAGITDGSLPSTGIMGASTGFCGRVYTVRSGDTLSRIAQNCGVTLKDLLAVNPSISNANLIRPGQKINMLYSVTETPPPAPTTPPSSIPGQPVIYGLRPGGKVMIAMEGFQAKAPVVVTLGPVGGEARFKTEAMTDPSGKLNMLLDIPITANPGESWVVTVQTVNPPNIVVSAKPFTIEK